MSALHSPDRRFLTVRHNNHQVHVAVFGGRAPGVRAKKINFLWLKFFLQPFNGFVQKDGLNCFHGLKIIMAARKAQGSMRTASISISPSLVTRARLKRFFSR